MREQKIVVIGGGVSGLATAIELARAGMRVTLLEARERLGGRIFTIHSGDVPIELGAEFIHGGNKELWRQIRAAKLKTSKVSNRFQLFENHSLRRVELWKKFGKLTERIGLNSPDESFHDFLEKQSLARPTKRLLTNFIEGFEAADPKRIGVHGLASSDGAPNAHQFRIREGYAALVHFLAKKAAALNVEIKTKTIVQFIRWKANDVKIGAKHNGQPVQFVADAAVITLPLGVLKSGAMTFKPRLPEKENAIAGLQFGNVLKLILKFRSAFWPKRNFGFITAVGEKIPTWWPDQRAAILTGWAGGPKADALAAKSNEALIAEALKILSRIFGKKPSALRAQLLEVHAHDWREDEFSRGAYSYVPVNGLKLTEILAAPVGNTLFFAGEATASDDEPGTVHGALSSGLRAAKKILKITKRR